MKKNKIEELQAFLKEEPGDSFVKYALALEHIKIGENTTALSYFEDILDADEKYLAVYYHAGKLLEQLLQRERAATIYEKGIQIAEQQSNRHALAELRQAYALLQEGDD